MTNKSTITFRPKIALQRIKEAITKGDVIYPIGKRMSSYDSWGGQTCILGAAFTKDERQMLAYGQGRIEHQIRRGDLKVIGDQQALAEFYPLERAFDTGDLEACTKIFDELDAKYS